VHLRASCELRKISRPNCGLHKFITYPQYLLFSHIPHNLLADRSSSYYVTV
jgi:hypothetical protein